MADDLTGGADDTAGPPTPLEALQRALAAEHAAVWVLAFLGARVPATDSSALADRLADAFEEHRASRDELTALVARAGAEPVASATDYELPDPASSPEQLRGAARTVEERVARTWAETVGATSGDDRRRAIAGLRASAVRALGFGAAPSDLPGLS
ncbi:DUF4439 domain-containing protein [Nocardioides aequoreus]|uniref:DUF4439 domain-containing protein n=1 Tax=Nocardioides aequoreus TaxID=397278 RepID=UPI00068DD6F0|nr:DUF4439 domain-containing protein [Nocardioides aequoreus]